MGKYGRLTDVERIWRRLTEGETEFARLRGPGVPGGAASVERSIYLKQSGGDVCEDVVGKKRTAAAATTSGIGGAALDDVRFAADFQVDGSTRGYVAGLTLTEAVELATATHSFQTSIFFDVNKTWNDDANLYWAATASNMRSMPVSTPE